MKMPARIAAFVAGAALFTLLIIHSGPALLWRTLRASAWVVGPLVALWGVVYLCNARAWQYLVPDRPARFTFLRAWRISITSFAINYATPIFSMGGEPLKVSEATPLLGRDRAVGSVVGFRLLHALSHILVFLTAIVPAAILLPHTPVVYTLLAVAAVLLALVAAFLLSQHRTGIFERGVALLAKLPLVGRIAGRLQQNRSRLEELDRAFTAVHGARGQFARALLTEMTGRVLSTMEYAIIFYGLGLGLDIGRAYVVANVSSLVTNLLFFLPFEIGSKEGGAFLVFAWLGLDPKLGTTAALLSRVRELCWVGIGLGVMLLGNVRSREQ